MDPWFLQASDCPVWAVCWSTSGDRLAVAGTDKVIRIYKFDPITTPTTPLSLCAELQGAHTKTIRSLDWSGRLLAAASFDATCSIWLHSTTDDYRCISNLEGHESEVKCVRFSPDGCKLATCGRDKTIWIWAVLHYDDAADVEFECEAVLQEHSQDVKSILWHPNSSILFSAGYDDCIKMFGCPLDQDEWLCLNSLKGHQCTVWAVALHQGTLFSVSEDGRAIKWHDLNKTGNPFNGFMQHESSTIVTSDEAIYCIESVDDCIVTGGADCSIRVCTTDGGAVSRHCMPSQVNAIRRHPTSNLVAAALDNGQVVLIKT